MNDVPRRLLSLTLIRCGGFPIVRICDLHLHLGGRFFAVPQFELRYHSVINKVIVELGDFLLAAARGVLALLKSSLTIRVAGLEFFPGLLQLDDGTILLNDILALGLLFAHAKRVRQLRFSRF